jgi:hypothetical protein
MSMIYATHPSVESRADALRRLDGLAHLLDSAVRVPGTSIRVGLDPLLNLMPGVGTFVAKGLSAYLIMEARRHGLPRATIAKMAGRVGVDFLLSIIPVVGWFGDVFYKSNMRNMAELRRHLAGPAADVVAPRYRA